MNFGDDLNLEKMLKSTVEDEPKVDFNNSLMNKILNLNTSKYSSPVKLISPKFIIFTSFTFALIILIILSSSIEDNSSQYFNLLNSIPKYNISINNLISYINIIKIPNQAMYILLSSSLVLVIDQYISWRKTKKLN